MTKALAGRQISFADDSDEYRAFVEKFKHKKTTDDCYTPPEIYDVVLDYVVERYGIDRAKVVRPFWPNCDYQTEDYPEGCVVVDNPPFSILSAIIKFYLARGVRFFLFAPTLTLISGRRHTKKVNHIATSAHVTYENGAKVNTSFITNLDEDGTVLQSEPQLSDAINAKDDELQKAKKKHMGIYIYPDEVITAAKVGWFSAHHTPYRLNARDCCFITHLDAMGGKSIFGGAYLLSERAAAERAAAERAAAERAAAERAAAERAAAERWELSEREREMARMLGGNDGQG